MKKGLILICLLGGFFISLGQGITLLWTGGTADGWNNPSNWTQINQPAGQSPIHRVPTELDNVVFSSSLSGASFVAFEFGMQDSLEIGSGNTTGYRCKSLQVRNTTLSLYSGATYSLKINVHTSGGGYVLIDSSANFRFGHFNLHGGNPSVKDLEIRNSTFGSLFSVENWSTIRIYPNGKLKLVNGTYGGHYIGSATTGGEMIAENSFIITSNFVFGSNSVCTITNTPVQSDNNNVSLNFFIGKNSTFNSTNVNVTSFSNLSFCTSGSTLRGNVTLQQESSGGYGGFRFAQQDTLNPLPNIIDGNLTFQGGQGTLGIVGDVKISGNFWNNAFDEQLIYPDTSHVFVNGQHIFKIGGITNYRNNVFIDNCIQNFCRFKFEFFGSGNSTIKWPVGIPLDTIIINKSGCGKVFVDNSLYVSGQLHVQSGQLVLNPNDGIPYKMVTAGNVQINSGAGIFLRRNVAGVPANIAIGGTLVNNNATSDSTCFGISNPYNGSILSYNPNVNNITVPVCVNSGTSIVSNVSGNTYKWELNNGTGYTLITNGPNFSGATTNTLQLLNIPSSWDGYHIRCIVNGSMPSHTFVLDLVSTIPASVSITSSSTTYCPFNPITFYAHPVNGGLNPVYQWQINGLNAGASAPMFTPANLANNDQVRLVMQSSLVCASPALSTSNVISITTPFVTPSVSIISSATTICSGSQVTFTPVSTNGGPNPFYQWLLNGVPAASGPSFTIPSLTSTSVVKAIMTSSHVCAVPLTATSNEVAVTVTSTSIIPTVSITASTTTICNNANVIFTASPINGGTQPTYQWQVNGINAGTNSPTFSTSTLANGSTVKVIMTSSSTCASPTTATSNSITVTVSNQLLPSVSITASAQSICNNTAVTFTALPVNGGAGPIYQWKKNGINIGANSSSLSLATLINADVIHVVMISNASCATPAPVSSNTITMTVANAVTPTITINGILQVDPGGSTTISSVINNGGISPAYQWQDSTASHGWQNIANAVSSILDYSPGSTGDRIRASLTSSANCANPIMVMSNELGFTVGRPSIPSERVTTYPNPATSYLVVDSLSTIDEWHTLTVMSAGGRIYYSVNIAGQNKITLPIQTLLPGMYIIRLSRSVGYPVFKRFIKL